MTKPIPPEELRIRRQLRDDFFAYANLLEIRTKAGGFEKLELNATQRELHMRLEKQRREKGRVRAIVLKGRQQGVSTYIAGRYYWRVSHRRGVRAFILSHTDDSSSNLFGMVDRFHENMNPLVKPSTGSANAKELSFAILGSGYKVATAGGRDVGRSETIQYVHGSEAAFWPNAEQHIAGLMQAVPETGETEIILESTANGLGGAYHAQWVAAERGESDFEAIFLPWFMHEEYQAPAPEDWGASDDWIQYGLAHKLTREQLFWAWRKSRDMGRSVGADPDKPCWTFRQEYPATSTEAFQTGGDTPFIPAEKVAQARRREVYQSGPIIIGVDPARSLQGSGDGTGIIDRQGRRLGQRICERWYDGDLMVTAGRLARVIKQWSPTKVFIDVGGVGAGLYDRMRELGFKQCEAVNFGDSPVGAGPLDPDMYGNRRSEMWDALREWFYDGAGVQCPDSDDFQRDVCAPAWGKGRTRHDSRQRLLLDPKDRMRQDLGFSPDLGDAAALTFAAPVLAAGVYDEDDGHEERRRTANRTTGY